MIDRETKQQMVVDFVAFIIYAVIFTAIFFGLGFSIVKLML